MTDGEGSVDALRRRIAELEQKLAERDNAFGERIDHQTATIDVLRAMAASPGDPRPVFDLIAERAKALCGAGLATLYETDGKLVYCRAFTSTFGTAEIRDEYLRSFPRLLDDDPRNGSNVAIFERRIVHVRDPDKDPGVNDTSRRFGARSAIFVPMIRDDRSIGAIALANSELGGFSDDQIALLRTFAEQAAIAISGAETYRALRDSLDQQTATGDVLKVISRSTFDLRPVLDMLLRTAGRLCLAEVGFIAVRENETFRGMATFGASTEHDQFLRDRIYTVDDSTLIGITALESKIIHIEDVSSHERYHSIAIVRLAGARTVLGVPLLRDGQVIGVIGLIRKRIERFTERQVELVSGFADQAAVAIENTRLLAEQREALEQQTATAEILRVINASLGDLIPVFDTILQKALRLCGAAFGILNTYDGDNFQTVATQGVPEVFARFRASNPPTARPGGPIARLLETRRPAQILDTKAEAGYALGHPTSRALVDLAGARTVVQIPLVKDETFLGFIAVYRQEVRAFSDKDIAILESFAAQAVIAMENARLLEELRERTEELTQRNAAYGERIGQQAATIDVLQAMAASPEDARPVFQLIVDRARTFCEAQLASLALVVDGMLVSPVHSGFSADAATGYEAAFPRPVGPDTVLGRAVLAGEASQLPDNTADSSYAPEMMSLADQMGTRSHASVPLRRGGVVIGAMVIARRQPGMYSDAQMELLRTFADQAVIALASAETFQALRDRTDDLARSLEQRSAVAEVMAAINANPGELAPVFDTILEKAHVLCGSAIGHLALYENGGFHRVAYRGLSTETSSAIFMPANTNTNSPRFRLVQGERFVHVPDLHHPDAPLSDVLTALRDQEGIRSFVLVPMRRDGALLGYISANWTEARADVTNEIALLESFAAQAVIAMENARLLTEQREALERQTATAEILRVINTSPGNLAPVFDTVLEKGLNLAEAAFGGLWLFENGNMHAVATRGMTPELAAFRASNPILPLGPAQLAQIRTRRPMQYADIRDSTGYKTGRAGFRAVADLGQARTMLLIPLAKDQAVLGNIQIYRQEVRPFTDKQIALLEGFAAQAVIAMENARLLTEQREALERQTATAEVLQVINASPGNLTPVFDAMMEKAMRLCEAAFGALALVEGDTYRVVAKHNLPPEVAETVAGIQPVRPGSAIDRIMRGEVIIHTVDAAADDAGRAASSVRRAMVDLGGTRTALWVALRKEGVPLGCFMAYRREVRPFTDRQIALLENFAAQAVIAMENARLLTEQQEALARQTAMADLLRVINESPGNVSPVFDAILEKAHQFCGAPSGNLTLYENGMLRAVATRGCPPEYVEYVTKPFPVGLYQQRLLDGDRLVHVLDGQADQDENDSEVARIFRERTGFRTLLTVPLRKDTELLGIISAFRPEVRAFSEAEITLIENFAAQAVIAMENARLLAEQAEALERQTAVADVLQVINRSPGDLVPVFNAMLERAFRLCDAEAGVFWVMEGETVTVGACKGFSDTVTTFLTTPFVPGPATGIGRLMTGEELVQIADLALAPGYLHGETMHRLVVDIDGLHALTAVPLRKDGVFLGAFGMMRHQPGYFTDKQIGLLRDFAAQAVIAMENARLLNEIRQRQGELDVTFQSMGDGVALFDDTRHLAAWNQNFQEMIDVPTELVSAKPHFKDYIQYLADRGEYGAESGPTVQRLLSQVGQQAAFERTRPNGRVIQIRTNPTPTGGFVVMYTDITERKRAEEALRAARDAAEDALRELKIAQANLVQAEKMASLGQLTAGIAHEIKNPLNFVNNFAALSVDLLAEFQETAAPAIALLTDDQRADIDDVSAMLTTNLQKITEHGKRADGIVRAMLEHSRGSSGERREVDLNALVDEALNLAYHGARAQDQSFNITLERDFGADIAPIEVNPQDLTRVFLNMFTNGFYAANKRAKAGGDPNFAPVLRVTTRNAGDTVEIRVRDNGTGIPDDIRDKLFQPFFTTKPTGEGTGLGLSITYDIVTKAHGGTITVESEVGVFTEFLVTLPRRMFTEQGERS